MTICAGHESSDRRTIVKPYFSPEGLFKEEKDEYEAIRSSFYGPVVQYYT